MAYTRIAAYDSVGPAMGSWGCGLLICRLLHSDGVCNSSLNCLSGFETDMVQLQNGMLSTDSTSPSWSELGQWQFDAVFIIDSFNHSIIGSLAGTSYLLRAMYSFLMIWMGQVEGPVKAIADDKGC